MTTGSSRSTGLGAQGNFQGNGCLSHRSSDRGTDTAPPGAVDGLREVSRHMLARLSSTIEGEIIPRLMLALDTDYDDYVPDIAPAPAAAPALADSVDEFVALVLSQDIAMLTRYISALRNDGATLPAIYLDLLAPAARQLGLMWERDECSFSDVTIGVCRMHQVLLEFSRCFDAETEDESAGRRALIVPIPGEQHTFGLFVVIEFMRRAGWNCWNGTPGSEAELLGLAGRHAFDVIGLSISADRNLDPARRLIARLRARSRNTGVTILAGGRVFNENPGLAAELGADGTAPDGREAAATVQNLKRKLNGESAG